MACRFSPVCQAGLPGRSALNHVSYGMRIESLVMVSAFALAIQTAPLSAQQYSFSPDAVFFLGQAPPTPPSPPAPPTPPMGDIVRLMSASGSYLGVGVRDIDSDRRQALNLKEERGAEITSVEDNSPAAKAGLKTGDVVLDYAGNRVDSMEQFIRLVRETPAGREVKINVSRNGTMTTVTARPESARSRFERSVNIRVPNPAEIRAMVSGFDSPRAAMLWKSSQLGVEAESIEAQLAEFFGVKEGVLVRSVARGSAAEKAGIKAGDVIVKVEETKVASPREVTSAVRAARANNKTVSLSLVREKKEMGLKVQFEDEPAASPEPRARPVRNKFQ